MRCLITGASGHLGSFLTKRLITLGWTVTALVRPESNLWRLEGVLDEITIVRANLSGVEDARPAIEAANSEVVFHLAWEGVISAFKNDPIRTVENVKGSLKLFELARDAGCRHWIGIGSQAEYGDHVGILTEDTATNPVTAYGSGKLSVGLQTMSLAQRYGIRHSWIRLLATYGPMDDERRLIPSVIIQLLRGQPLRLTAGEQFWDYLYVEDAADALYEVAAKAATGVFNLGSGTSYSIRSIIERLRDLIDPSLPLVFGEVSYPADQIMRLETSIDRIHQATGWNPRVSLDEGLARTVDWYKSSVEASLRGHPQPSM